MLRAALGAVVDADRRRAVAGQGVGDGLGRAAGAGEVDVLAAYGMALGEQSAREAFAVEVAAEQRAGARVEAQDIDGADPPRRIG
ncbi:hypothetical protein D9M70_446060 [compost metagenome]